MLFNTCTCFWELSIPGMTRDKPTAPKESRAEIHHCLKLTDPKGTLQYFLHTQTQQGWAQDKCVSKFNLLTEQLRQTVSENLRDSWIPTATTDPVSVDDTLRISEVLFIRKDLLRTSDWSSTESNTSGLCYCAVQHWIFFWQVREPWSQNRRWTNKTQHGKLFYLYK